VEVLPPLADGDLAVASLSQPGDPSEREAERVASDISAVLTAEGAGEATARATPEPSPEGSPGAAPQTGPAATLAPEAAPEPEPEAGPPTEAGLERSLLVEDDAEPAWPGQMRKGPFIAELKAAVCATAEQSLAGVGRSARSCPYLERWFAHYLARSAAHGERALRRYAPEARGATAARDYIPAVCARVRQGIATWAATGEVTGVPPELAAEVPRGTAGGAGGILSALGGAEGGVARLLTKARPGESPRPSSSPPEAVLAQLGAGRPLDAGIRSPFERAFGYSFAAVRVHTDGSAGRLAEGLSARAFTVGNHVAFASGEYRPGILVGDAILSHELAHVVQQGGAAAPAPEGVHHGLEEEADLSAVGAVASMWLGDRRGLSRLAREAVPRLRSGLRLQRCAAGTAERRPTTAPAIERGPTGPGTATAACPSRTEVERTIDMTPGGLDKGYRTAYGIASVMKVLPDERDWDGTNIIEHLTNARTTCPETWNMCTGGTQPFVVGRERYSTILGNLPALHNRFYDFHTSRWNGSRLHDAGQNPGGLDACTVVCNQDYSCGGAIIGRHVITRNFRKSTHGGRDVTVVTTTKT